METILNEIKKYYELDLEYFEFEYKNMNVKIRMNKNHSRNHDRNDDKTTHNLSLVNVFGGGNTYFETKYYSTTYINKQVFGIKDWEDAQKEILDFISDIDFNN
jgi:hypothetical protein